MRIGLNPNKDKALDNSDYFHQVIIPLNIPHHEDYFKESLIIFKKCLESLFKTCHSSTYFTIVNNGSSEEVKNYLNELFLKNEIQEVVHTTGIGKLNSILKGISGHQFQYVTISDADVLFLDDWQKASYQIFNNFRKAGAVGLSPQFKQFEYSCGNVLFENFFSKQLAFTDVTDAESLKKFYKSLGWNDDYNKDYLKKNLTITSQNNRAIVGNGHFVSTYKGELFLDLPKSFNVKMGAGSEDFLDQNPLKFGRWRLTTDKNYAFHMGNTFEPWMEEELLKITGTQEFKFDREELTNNKQIQKISVIENFIKNKAFLKIFSIPWVRRFFYRAKGLPQSMVNSF